VSSSSQANHGGKEGIFIKLLVAAQPRIFGYLVTLLASLNEAEEVMQETSIVMWDKFDDFTISNRLSEKTIEDFVAWGNQIAYFKVLNLRRKKSLSTTLLSEKVIQMVSNEWTKQEETKSLENRRQALKQCVDKLPTLQRGVLEDYYWQKLSVDRIADRSQRTPASIYKLLQRVRDSLYKCISNRLSEEL
jgi:RNA polymerase sigma-70 factor (ECF subfamily)